MLLKVIFYYAITICGATCIVACFSKRKAVIMFSAIFVLFFAFFNFFSAGIFLFFMNLQNILFTLYDTIFDKIRILSENGNSNLFKRISAIIAALVVALGSIQNIPLFIPSLRIRLYYFHVNQKVVVPLFYHNHQNINLIFARLNC